MAFNFGRGLAAFGESVARTAGAMSLEAMRADLEMERTKLANEMALQRESVGRKESQDFAKEQAQADRDFKKPAQDASIRASDAQVERERATLGIAKEKEGRAKEAGDAMAGVVSGTVGSGDRADILARARNAIASIEEGPEGYASVGRETTYKDGSKDKPYGRYQVMGKNVAQWTKEALGREMTPEEFLKDGKAQDAVFNHRFGGYLEKYGNPQDAASAWFSGRPRSQAGNDKDVLGTSVPAYVAKFDKAFGSGGAGTGPSGGALDQMPADYRRMLEIEARKGNSEKVLELVDAWNARRLAATAKNESWVPLGKEAATALGLDPNKSHQINTRTGKIDPIGSGPTVNIDQKQESTALKVQAEEAVKTHKELQEAAQMARNNLNQINRLDSLMDQLSTGKFSATELEIKRFAKYFGIDLGEKEIGVAEAADALSKQLALQMRNPAGGAGMPGAMSDADREFLIRTIPSLGTSPEGRKQMVEMARAMYQRSIDVARIANEHVRSKDFSSDPSGLYAKLQEFADKNPLFPQAPGATQGGPRGQGEATRPGLPSVGEVMEGYRFKGGNPADRNSWEPVR